MKLLTNYDYITRISADYLLKYEGLEPIPFKIHQILPAILLYRTFILPNKLLKDYMMF